MFSLFISVAAGFLLGLAFLGYVCILAFLQVKARKLEIHPLVKGLATLAHFGFGITALAIVPAFIYRTFRASLGSGGGILFAFTGFAMLGLVFYVVREWNKSIEPNE